MLYRGLIQELSTGIDLSKILKGGNQNIGKGQKVAITDEILGVSQLLEGTSASPKSTHVSLSLNC